MDDKNYDKALSGTNKIVITRKEHRCFGCYRKFPAGTKLLSWSTLNVCDNTGYFTEYVCPVCHSLMHEDGYLSDEGFGMCWVEGFAIEPDKDAWEKRRKEIEEPEIEQSILNMPDVR